MQDQARQQLPRPADPDGRVRTVGLGQKRGGQKDGIVHTRRAFGVDQIKRLEPVTVMRHGPHRVEDHHPLPHLAAPSCGDGGVFALGVDHDDRARKTQKGGHNGTDSFARTGWGDGNQMTLAFQKGSGR